MPGVEYKSPVGNISIHAPRVGCDDKGRAKTQSAERFQSTHSGWGATHIISLLSIANPISIHAPRVGCDSIGTRPINSQIDFNPRTPGGVRPASLLAFFNLEGNFNPRTPGGVRQSKYLHPCIFINFNPRTPGGVRHSVG